jgi:hypothetical protein
MIDERNIKALSRGFIFLPLLQFYLCRSGFFISRNKGRVIFVDKIKKKVNNL